VAANRDCSAPAVAAPISPSPMNSPTTLPADRPRTHTPAPAAAISAAPLSEIRRPWRSASRASGIARAAAPKVDTVAANPDQAAPANALAASAPTDSAAPMPSPLRIWPRVSRARVRRRSRARASCTWVGGGLTPGA
jgi:hypothetical protein